MTLADPGGFGRGGRLEVIALGWRLLIGGCGPRGAPPLVTSGVEVEYGAPHRLLPRPRGCLPGSPKRPWQTLMRGDRWGGIAREDGSEEIS